MSTENPKAPEKLFESINAESKRLMQGMIRSEDTVEIASNLTSLWSQLVMHSWTNPQGWLEMVNQYQKDQFKLWDDLINGTVDS